MARSLSELLTNIRMKISAQIKSIFHMRAAAELGKTIKEISCSRRAWRGVTTLSVRKPENEHTREGYGITNENVPLKDNKAEPVVAFCKPPSSPFLGPLVVLSLLEICSGGDKNDD